MFDKNDVLNRRGKESTPRSKGSVKTNTPKNRRIPPPSPCLGFQMKAFYGVLASTPRRTRAVAEEPVSPTRLMVQRQLRCCGTAAPRRRGERPSRRFPAPRGKGQTLRQGKFCSRFFFQGKVFLERIEGKLCKSSNSRWKLYRFPFFCSASVRWRFLLMSMTVSTGSPRKTKGISRTT